MAGGSDGWTGNGEEVVGNRHQYSIPRYGDSVHIHRLFTMTVKIA